MIREKCLRKFLFFYLLGDDVVIKIVLKVFVRGLGEMFMLSEKGRIKNCILE